MKKENYYWSRAPGKMLYAQELSPLLTHLTHYLVSKPYNNKPQGGGMSLSLTQVMSLGYLADFDNKLQMLVH